MVSAVVAARRAPLPAHRIVAGVGGLSRRPDQVNQWWLEHFDPHMKVLTATNGPFGACSQGKGHQGDAAGLKVEPMPADWLNFTPPRTEAAPATPSTRSRTQQRSAEQ